MEDDHENHNHRKHLSNEHTHDEHHETHLQEPVHKPTKQELEKLRAEVIRQNRRLLFAALAVLVVAVLIFVGVQVIKQHATPQPWSYENAVLEVYDGKINDNQYPYNGLIFARQDNNSLWTFQGNVNGSVFDISAYYGPKEVESIPVDDYTFWTIMSKDTIVLALNTSLDDVPYGGADGGIAAVEIARIVGTKYNMFNKPVVSALTSEPAGVNISNTSIIANCYEATQTIGVIQFEVSNATRVRTNGRCILVQGATPQDLIRASDALMYHALGVMKTQNEIARMQNLTNAQNGSGAQSGSIITNISAANASR